MSLRYSAIAEPNPTFDALLPMLRASSADELEEAKRPWVDPDNNLVFADDQRNDRLPHARTTSPSAPANAWLPVPGWYGAHESTAPIPFAEMPTLRDPAAGWIATANSRIVDAAYPHYLGLDYASDFRTRRLVARLRDIHGATVADMAAIHADRSSIPARALLELASRIEPLDAGSREALAMLRRWDGAMDADSAPAAIYAADEGAPRGRRAAFGHAREGVGGEGTQDRVQDVADEARPEGRVDRRRRAVGVHGAVPAPEHREGLTGAGVERLDRGRPAPGAPGRESRSGPRGWRPCRPPSRREVPEALHQARVRKSAA